MQTIPHFMLMKAIPMVICKPISQKIFAIIRCLSYGKTSMNHFLLLMHTTKPTMFATQVIGKAR